MRRLLLCLTLATACGPSTTTGATGPTPPPDDRGDHTRTPDPDRCRLLSCAAAARDAAQDDCPDPFLEFKANSAEPGPLTMDLIEQLAAEIKATPTLRGLRLDGHAGTGETEDLARERAQAVRGHLIDSGVPAALLEITGRVNTDADATYVTFEATDCGTPSTATAPDGDSSVGAVNLVLQ